VFLAALPAIIGPIMSAAGGAIAAAGSAALTGLSAAAGAVGGAATPGVLGGMSVGQALMLGGTLASTGVSVGGSMAQAKTQERMADAQQEQAIAADAMARGQANVRLEQERQASGQERQIQAMKAAEQRGVVQASGLPVSSIRAMVRNVEAQRGRGDVAIRTNLEYAQQAASAEKQAAGLNLQTRLIDAAGTRMAAQGTRFEGAAAGFKGGMESVKLGRQLFSSTGTTGR
jgi:hypothetical protein